MKENEVYYSAADIAKMTGLTKTYVYAISRDIVGYYAIKDPGIPGKRRIIRFKKSEVDYAVQMNKPLIMNRYEQLKLSL